MSAAQVPPPIEPFCVAHAHTITRPADGWARDRVAVRCEVQGHPDPGGVYYWTPEQARAIFLALRTFGVLGDGA